MTESTEASLVAAKTESKLGRDASVYVAGIVLQRGLGLILLPIATRLLGKAGYGRVGTATAIATVLAMVFALGLDVAIGRLYFDDAQEARATKRAMFLRFQLVAAFFLAGLSWVTGPYWGELFNEIGWGPELQIAVGYAVAISLQNSTQGLLRSAKRKFAFVSVTLLQVITGGVLGIVLAADHGAAGYLLGLTAGSFVAAIAAGILTYEKADWQLPPLWAGLTLSAPFLVHRLSGWTLNLSDRVFLERYSGLEAVGQYAVVAAIGAALYLLLDGIQAAWAPHYFGDLSSTAQRALPGNLVEPLTMLSASVSGIFVATSPILMSILVPPSFGELALPLALIIACTVPKVAYLLASVVLMNVKDSRSRASASMFGAAANVGLNLLLIPAFGIVAAAATTYVANALIAGATMRASNPHIISSFNLFRIITIWLATVPVLIGVAMVPDEPWGVFVRGVALFGFGALSLWQYRLAASRYASLHRPSVPQQIRG